MTDAVRYKRPGIIRAGFRYQDLMAIDVLVRFYRDRGLYQWVELDSDDSQFGGIDDVVACRPDGRFDLLQVKFTPDPTSSATALDWNWLLAHRPRGTSLLQKWSATVDRHARTGGLASARLRTDRIPDNAFAATLSGSRVDFARVEADVRAEIVKQLGGHAIAEAFFAVFDFNHSEPILSDLEDKLRTEVAFDLDGSAWLSFRDTVENWATLKHRPEPDGRILHEHLRQALSVHRPRPLPQGFEVPSGYEPPDANFAEAFLRLAAGKDGVTVLTGPPGRGKSTFLSHCVERLLDDDFVVIRHHYFLDLADRSAGRFHYHEIANSLTSQIKAQVKEQAFEANDLAGAIATAGRIQADAGLRLVVVIDGLDHVWREGRSKEHMTQLFAELLPVPPGVAIIVGTQPAPDTELPVKLLQQSPRAEWLELPLMSPEAVAHWIDEQDAAERLNLPQRDDDARARARDALASSFFKISGGLPLHLIYAFEALVRTGAPLTTELVETLPSCPSGDIRRYYTSLWAQVGSRAQDILHVMTALPFAIPPLSLRQVFAEVGDAEALARIDHLLDHRELGVYPFHGSLFAFVQEQAGRAVALAARQPKILEWLEQQAPPYWRWAWLWLTQAQFGDATAILTRPDRPWALAALADAYPVDQIGHILRTAEEAAFARSDLPRTLELRLLRSRVENGAEYQTDRWDLFLAAALEVTPDSYPLADLRANLLDIDIASVCLVLRRAEPSERASLARQALDEFNRRLRREEKRDRNWRHGLPDAVGQLVAHLENVDALQFDLFCQQYRVPDDPLTAFAREALRMREPKKVLNLAAVSHGPEFNAEVFAAACFESIDPFAAANPLKLEQDPRLQTLSLLLGGRPPELTDTIDLLPLFQGRDLSDRDADTRSLVSAFFFRAFCSTFQQGKGRPQMPLLPEISEQSWLSTALDELADMAMSIAEAWREYEEPPTMAALYAGLAPIVAPEGSYEVHARYQSFRLAVLDIAIDLQLLGLAVSRANLIEETDIAAASQSPLWLDEAWLHASSSRPLQIHALSGAQAVAARIFNELEGGITQFAERVELCIRLSVFCSEHGLVDHAASALQRAASGITGYGWRKDTFGYEVLASLELLHDQGDTDAARTLLSLAPIFDQITEFTDGDETDHIKTEFYKLLARYNPERAGAAYGYLIRVEEWKHADGLLIALVSELPAGPRREALLSTFIQPTEARWLAAEGAKGDSDATAALERVNRYLGAEQERGQVTAASDPAPPDQSPFDVSLFAPERLDELVAALDSSGTVERRGVVGRWLQHWDQAGCGLKAIQALEASKIDDELWTFAQIFDDAFRIALRDEGRSAAFKWLVLAHRANYGWQRWITSNDEAIKRLDLVAEHYPERWLEFVQLTAAPKERRGDDQSLILGMSRLVYLLLKVGRTDLAKAITNTLVETLRAETMEQPLPTLAWAA